MTAPCPACNGSGKPHYTIHIGAETIDHCLKCDGSGEVEPVKPKQRYRLYRDGTTYEVVTLPDGLTHRGLGFFDIDDRGEGWTQDELREMADAAARFVKLARPCPSYDCAHYDESQADCMWGGSGLILGEREA